MTPLSVDLAGEELMNQINLCMGNAVAVADQYADVVIGVMDGSKTYDEILPSSAEEDEE